MRNAGTATLLCCFTVLGERSIMEMINCRARVHGSFRAEKERFLFIFFFFNSN